MPSVIKIPEELAHELDRLAAAEHKPRVTYVVDLLLRDVRRNKQRAALRFHRGPGVRQLTLNWLRAARFTSIGCGPKRMKFEGVRTNGKSRLVTMSSGGERPRQG